MPVPLEILQVPRPENTTVYAYGKHKNLYGVREKIGTKVYKGRARPVYGKTVGHIINKMYVPKKESEMGRSQDLKDVRDIKEWGACVLCDRLAKPILLDLFKFFDHNEAVSLFCIAILKVLEPGIRDYELKDAFLESWLSEMYPMASLSKNSVSSLLKQTGQHSSRIVGFIQMLNSSLKEDDVLAVDGTLKRNNSKINTYSRYSRNYHKKGELGNISILYALDLNTGLPKAFRAYPGNVSDSKAYGDFIQSSGIKSGLLIGDKAFTESAARKQFKKYPQLHFLHPLKRNARIIQILNLRKYQGVLPGFSDIYYKKSSYYDEELKKTIYLYSYLDGDIFCQELKSWGDQHRELDPSQFENEFEDKRPGFGTILLQSDLDLTPLQAYLLYKGRWQIELLMRLYKQALEAGATFKHSNYSILGSEFVNFLALSIESRLRNYLAEKGVLNKTDYKAIIKELKGAEIERYPDKKDWELKTKSTKVKTLLQTLELLPSQPPKRRGRPPGVKNSSNAKAAKKKAQSSSGQPVKRGPGRPRKDQNQKTLDRKELQALKQPENSVLTTAEALVEHTARRKRGRPPGAKNKKTIEREKLAALAKAKQEQQNSWD